MRKGGGSLNSLEQNISYTHSSLPAVSFIPCEGQYCAKAKHDIVSKMKSSPRHHLPLCDGLTSHRLEC
jgi:hypothetical protein